MLNRLFYIANIDYESISYRERLYTKKGRKIKRPEPVPIQVELPPILDEAEFQTIQEKILALSTDHKCRITASSSKSLVIDTIKPIISYQKWQRRSRN